MSLPSWLACERTFLNKFEIKQEYNNFKLEESGVDRQFPPRMVLSTNVGSAVR